MYPEYWNSDYDPEEEEERRFVINSIAKQLLIGRITDDNPSDTNGFTALEQILVYELAIDDPVELAVAKEKINCRINELSGGCNMALENWESLL